MNTAAYHLGMQFATIRENKIRGGYEKIRTFVDPSSVPEPTTTLILGLGLAGVAVAPCTGAREEEVQEVNSQ